MPYPPTATSSRTRSAIAPASKSASWPSPASAAACASLGGNWDHGLDILPNPRFTQVSRHLLWGGPHTCSNFYVLLSDSGKACFIDYGHAFWAHMAVAQEREDGDTMRFVVHHLHELQETYGVHDIDLVLVTHIHDDHTAGIPYLVRHESTRVWALDEVAQVLEDPAGWCSTPCTLAPPIPIERQLTDGERFTWEEFDFEVHHAPGQTEFHSVLATHVDGQKVAFTGDNVFLELAPGITGEMTTQLFQTTVLRNSLQLWMHRRCADVMDLVEPDLVCPGHRELIPWDSRRALEYRDFIDRKERVVRDLLDDPADEGVDLWWARLIPYLRSVEPGETCTYRLLLRNNAERSVRLEAPPSHPQRLASHRRLPAPRPRSRRPRRTHPHRHRPTPPRHPPHPHRRNPHQRPNPRPHPRSPRNRRRPRALVVAHLDSTPILESIRRLPLSTRKSNRVLGKSPSRRTALNPSPGGEVRVRGLPLEIVTYAKPLCHTPHRPYEETPPHLINLARSLRKRQTNAELVLWWLLRSRQMGVKFRRQHPMQPYVLDFYCHELRLAVEVDGYGHDAPAGRANDVRRTAALEAQGIQVLRFTNLQVLQETRAVAETLWRTCRERRTALHQPPPTSPAVLILSRRSG